MKKRHSVKHRLHQLEEEHRNDRPHLAALIHHISQLIEPETTLEEEQFIEVLHLLAIRAKNRSSIAKVVPEIVTMINSSYTVHLLANLLARDK